MAKSPTAVKALAVAPSAQGQLSQTLRSYIQQCGLLPSGEVVQPEHRREQLRKARDAGLAASIMKGYWLSEIKAREGSEAHGQACAELNISKTAAHYDAANFELFNQFDDLEVVQALSCLEPSKFRALRFDDAAEWTAFAKGQPVRGLTLSEAVEAPFLQIEKQQRDWRLEQNEELQRERQSRKDAEARLKLREAELHKAAQMDGRASPAIDKRLAAVRDRGMHLAQRALHEVALLRDLIQEELVDGYDITSEDAADRRAVVSLLYHVVGGVMAAGDDLRTRVGVTFSKGVTGTLIEEARYTAKEADWLRQLCEAAATAADADDSAAKVKSRKDNRVVGRHGPSTR